MAEESARIGTQTPEIDSGLQGLSVDEIVKIGLEYRSESEEARRERLADNKLNRQAYLGRQDWSEKIDGQSKEFLPKTSETAEQFRAFIKRGLVQFGDWFSVEVSKRSPLSAESVRSLIMAYIDRLPDENKTTTFAIRISDGAQVALLEVEMIFKVHGRRHTQRVFSVEEDGTLGTKELEPWRLHIDLVRPEDYYPDPSGRGLYEIHEVERDLIDIVDNPIYDQSVVNEIRADFVEDAHKAREEKREPPSFRKRVVLTEVWGDLVSDDGTLVQEKMLWTIANKRWLIRKPERFPYWHGESPFVKIPLVRVPFSVNHRALYDDVVRLNFAQNELFNLMLDGGISSVWGIKQLRMDYLDDPRQVTGGIAQGTTLSVSENAPDGAKVLETVTEGQVPQDALAMFQVLDREVQAAALTNEIKLGHLPSKQVRATEIVEASQSQAVVLDSIVGDMEHGITELLRKAWLTILQMSDMLSTLDIGDALTTRELLALSRMTEAQRFSTMAAGTTFKVFGLSATLAKARDFQRLMAVMQVATSNPLLLPAAVRNTSPDKIWKLMLKMVNLNPQQLERDESELANVETDMNALASLTGAQRGIRTDIAGEPGLPGEINQEAVPTSGL